MDEPATTSSWLQDLIRMEDLKRQTPGWRIKWEKESLRPGQHSKIRLVYRTFC